MIIGEGSPPFLETEMKELITFICCWLVKHGGKLYQANQDIELTEAEAAPLLKSGAITVKKPEEIQLSTAEDESLKLAKVVTAIAGLDADNKDHFTTSGKPNANALSELVGFDVSAKLRDLAFEQTQTKGQAE